MSPAVPEDKTSLITNPGYEDSSWKNGWTVVGFTEHENGGKFSGSQAPEMWSRDLVSGSIKQTLTNLPIGVYALSATVTAGFGGETYIYAGSENNKASVNGIDGDPTQAPIVWFTVSSTDQEVEIGFVRNNAQWWTAVDDWTLKFFANNNIDDFNNNKTSASVSTPVDASCFIINPDANNGTMGWIGEFGVLPEKSGSDGDFFEPAGWWKASSSMSQTVMNLPNGFYSLKMNYQAAENVEVTLQGNTNSKSVMGTNEGWKTLAVICTVTDGTLTITASSIARNNELQYTWFNADNFELMYLSQTFESDANMKVAAGKFGTFIAPFNVILPENVVAYTCAMNDANTSVSLTQSVGSGSTLAACTPVILKNDGDVDVNVNFHAVDVRDDKNTVSEEKEGLVGFYVDGETIPADGTAYVMQTQNDKQAFYKVATPFTGVANRCYLKSTSNGANVLRFDGDEEIETSIESILNNEQTTVIYDLSGRRVSNTAKGGIYIINGKKVIK